MDGGTGVTASLDLEIAIQTSYCIPLIFHGRNLLIFVPFNTFISLTYQISFDHFCLNGWSLELEAPKR